MIDVVQCQDMQALLDAVEAGRVFARISSVLIAFHLLLIGMVLMRR